jgi:anti-sigma regulatory factor (Ser/Thr protein kinase)
MILATIRAQSRVDPIVPTQAGYSMFGTAPVLPEPLEVQMRTLLSVQLPPDATAPGMARMALRDLPVGVHPDVATLEMLVSELVTNSVKHALLASMDEIELVVRDGGDRLRVEVRDPGKGYDEAVAGWSRTSDAPPSRPLAQDGYGLLLVSAVADRSGVSWENGTLAWFELDNRTRATRVLP